MKHLVRLNSFKQNNNFMMIHAVSMAVISCDSRQLFFFPPLSFWPIDELVN